MTDTTPADTYIFLADHGLLIHLGKDRKQAPVSADIRDKKTLSPTQMKRLDEVVEPLIDRWVLETEAEKILDIPNFKGSDDEKKQLVLQVVEYAKSRESYDGKLDHVMDKLTGGQVEDKEEKRKKKEEEEERKRKEEEERKKKEEEEERKRKGEEERKKEEEERKRKEEKKRNKKEESKKKREQKKAQVKEEQEESEMSTEMSETSEDESEASDFQGGVTQLNSGRGKGLYSKKNTDASKRWPYHIVSDGDITILFEKQTNRKRDGVKISQYGVQIKKDGLYQRELWDASQLNEKSYRMLEEWKTHGTVEMDKVNDGIVTEIKPSEDDRLVFQTSKRSFPREAYGSIRKILFLLPKDYKSSYGVKDTFMTEWCVLFEKTKYPKVIQKGKMNLRGSIIAAALKQIMERDGLGTLEQHAPLTTKFYNPKSRQYDEDVHKKHALPSFGGQAGDLPKQGPAQETQAEQAIEKRLDQMFTVLMALDKRLKIVEENMD